MEKTITKLEYSIVNSDSKKIPVIIVAAGNASRMGGMNKQLLEIGGTPVIARTLSAFQNSPLISKIILVTKPEDIFKMQSICSEYGISKISDITEGGKDRHESVLCGMKRLSENDKTVLIHDGARPFVNDKIIADCIDALGKFDGCLCAVKVSDTVKQVSAGLTVEKTVDRTGLYLAQTPQGVNKEKYMEASEKYKNIGFTDDASVLEAAGYSVKIVSGSKDNIKITTPEDIIIAESIISRGAI